MIKIMFVNDIMFVNVRIIDIFLTGPLQLNISYYVKHIWLKLFLISTGIMTIIYNLHNYLYLDIKKISKPWPILRYFVTNNGKSQYHRLYNVFIMYPIFLYALSSTKNIPDILRVLFFCEIIIGTIFNLFNYIKLR